MVIGHGRIVQQGTEAELRASDGPFRRLARTLTESATGAGAAERHNRRGNRADHTERDRRRPRGSARAALPAFLDRIASEARDRANRLRRGD